MNISTKASCFIFLLQFFNPGPVDYSGHLACILLRIELVVFLYYTLSSLLYTSHLPLGWASVIQFFQLPLVPSIQLYQ